MSPARGVLAKTLKDFGRKQFLDFARKSHPETMQLTACQTSLCSEMEVNPDQAGRALPGHEAASPTVAWIKILFVTPEHFQRLPGGFFPTELIIHVPFP